MGTSSTTFLVQIFADNPATLKGRPKRDLIEMYIDNEILALTEIELCLSEMRPHARIAELPTGGAFGTFGKTIRKRTCDWVGGPRKQRRWTPWVWVNKHQDSIVNRAVYKADEIQGAA